MEQYFAMGLFSLYVVLVSLVRFLPDGSPPYLNAVKKFWGRPRGIALCFVAQVAVPLVFGIVFLSRGIAGLTPGPSIPPHAPSPHNQVLVRLCNAPTLFQREIRPAEVAVTGKIPLLLAVAVEE